MLFAVEPNPSLPLYEQIAASIRRAMGDGSIAEGDRLPATRDLAESLGVNMHTVVRAYGVLRDEGLVEMRRGRGAIVRTGAEGTAEVTHLVAELAMAARRHGLTLHEIVDLITKEMT